MPAAAERRGRWALPATLALVLATLPGLAGTSTVAGPPAAAADPYALLDDCRSSLAAGRLPEAEDALARLRDMLRKTPGWDPDGTFREHLIPNMEARIGPLRQAVARLDALHRERWQTLQPPARLLAQGNTRAYVNHITDVLLQIREERDAIVAGVANLEDRAVLYETPAYQRIRTVLDTGVLQRLHAAADDVVRRLDQEARTFRALAADPARPGATLSPEAAPGTTFAGEDPEIVRAATRQRMESYLDALAAMINEGAGVSPEVSLREQDTVDEVLADLLEQWLQEQRQAATQTPAERQARLARVERFRHTNDVLVGAGIVRDRGDTLDELAELVESTPLAADPVDGQAPATAGGDGTVLGAGHAALLLLLAAGVWLATLAARRRARKGPSS